MKLYDKKQSIDFQNLVRLLPNTKHHPSQHSQKSILRKLTVVCEINEIGKLKPHSHSKTITDMDATRKEFDSLNLSVEYSKVAAQPKSKESISIPIASMHEPTYGGESPVRIDKPVPLKLE